MRIRSLIAIVATVSALYSIPCRAASGEMGSGIPQFGSYSSATGAQTVIWSLDNTTTSFPAPCTSISITPATMGMDTYKISIAYLLTAKASGRRVRLYAHAPRGSGCEADYVELQ